MCMEGLQGVCLTAWAAAQIVQEIQEDEGVLQRCRMEPAMLPPLVEHNPGIAAAVRLSSITSGHQVSLNRRRGEECAFSPAIVCNGSYSASSLDFGGTACELSILHLYDEHALHVAPSPTSFSLAMFTPPSAWQCN